MTANLTAKEVIAKLEILGSDNVLDLMDETLIRIVRAAQECDGNVGLSLADVLEIITYELALDGE